MNHNHDNIQNIDPGEPQLWQAYLYVIGEMSTSESLQFEQQLSESPELCKLVGELTLLNDLLLIDGARLVHALSPKESLQDKSEIVHAGSTAICPTAKVNSCRPQRVKMLRFDSMCAGILLVFGLTFIYLTKFELVKFPAQNQAENDAALKAMSVQEMSGMLGVWLNKSIAINNETFGSNMQDLMDEEIELAALSTESSQQPEVPEWLLIALQIEEHEPINSDEI